MGALRLLVALLAALRCLRLAIPCQHPLFRSGAIAGALPHRPGLCCAGVPPALLSWSQRALPGSWATRSASALLSDPGRAVLPSLFGTPVLPPLTQRRRPQRSYFFRGSITRLLRSLSTLRPRGRPHQRRKTRFRLPATLYRVGLVTHRAATRGFLRSHIFPPLPDLAWRDRSHTDESGGLTMYGHDVVDRRYFLSIGGRQE